MLICNAAIAYTAFLKKRKLLFIFNQRVNIKHLLISQNTTIFNFENEFTDILPDLTVVCLVADADFSIHYNKNPFDFQDFCVYCMELKRNGISVLRQI